MKKLNHIFPYFIILTIFSTQVLAQDGDYRSDCVPPLTRTELNINNVRAHLQTGGEIWDFLPPGGYFVPKELGTTAIRRGSIWVGGKDEEGKLKVSGQVRRYFVPVHRFKAGPLDENGDTEPLACHHWDRFFSVKAEDIEYHQKRIGERDLGGQTYTESDIPESILGWPAHGNPYFSDIHGFDLPINHTSLGDFHDYDQDGVYNPSKGDYPVIKSNMRGDQVFGELVPSEQIFHIINDLGINRNEGDAMQLQINATAFAYQADDEINDMTFYQYKVINRSQEVIDDMYFSISIDPQLGCYGDDLIGTDTSRNMFYIYNEDDVDGLVGCDCAGVPTYCENIPIVGLRFFNTPDQVGMTSSAYHQSTFSLVTILSPLRHPNTIDEMYNFMTGRWRDGAPLTKGGNGYNPNSLDTTKFVFTSPPNEQEPYSWSMCTANLDFLERTVIASTYFGRMEPGEEKELIFGVVFVPSQKYICPDISYLQYASDRAEIFLLDQLFDGSFKPQGPEAPDMTVIESDRELVMLLSNEVESNNFQQSYRDRVPLFRDSMDKDEFNYLFEGYILYQLSDPSVTIDELDDMNKARVIFQGDLKNDVSDIYNWIQVPDPFFQYNIFVPELMVEGSNTGIRKSIRITEDAFATGEDKGLVNHQPYHYMAIAYAHNSYRQFDLRSALGQRMPFLPGAINVQNITATPRPESAGGQPPIYGTEFPITRLDGAGNPGIFLELEEDSYDRIFQDDFNGQLEYKASAGPVKAKVVNPENLRHADLLLYLFNEDESIGVGEQTRWALRDLETEQEIFSDYDMGRFSEQIINEYGISLEMFLADPVGVNNGGNLIHPTNGIVNTRFKYLEEEGDPWLRGIGSTKSLAVNDGTLDVFYPLNYVKNDIDQPDYNLDPTQAFTGTLEPSFVPFFATDYRLPDSDGQFLLSPMPIHSSGGNLRSSIKPNNVNNVDLVLTSDKSKWTRSVVLQSSNFLYTSEGFPTSDNTNVFDHRDHPSIGLDGTYATEDGTKTGDVLTSSSNDPGDANYIEPMGMGWFPGYAINVETGQRLNILFAENSSYHDEFQDFFKNGEVIGDDMIWNPNDQDIIEDFGPNIMSYFMGGQHYIYITNSEYDGGANLHRDLRPRRNLLTKRRATDQITWAGFTMLKPGQELLSYEEGLIPQEMVIQLRVNQPYQSVDNATINGMPHYLIHIDSDLILQSSSPIQELTGVEISPNPMLSSVGSDVNLHHLPQQCQIHVFDIHGHIILHEKIDGLSNERLEFYALTLPKNRMKPGSYFIRVQAPNEGVQVLKLLYF